MKNLDLPRPIDNLQFKTVPYSHQHAALFAGYGREAFAYFMEMRTGKSKVAIDELSNLYLEGLIGGALLIANKGSYLTWEEANFPEHFMYDKIPVKFITWTADKASKLIDEVRKPFAGLVVLVANVESFAFPKVQVVAEAFLNSRPCYMNVDESGTIKNKDAARTKAITELGQCARFRRIMTGTPITKNPLDLWSQCEFLKPGLLGHRSYFSFRNVYANLITMTAGVRVFKKITGFRNLDDLTERVQSFSYRITAAECLDLPEKVYQTRFVELTPEQKRLYNELKDEAIAFLSEQESLSATLVVTRLLRLHQIVCGQFKDDNGIIHKLPNNRISVLMDTLEEISDKTIIWANYTENIDEIKEAVAKEYGYESVVTYYGATNDEDRKEAIKAFQDPLSPVRFFIGNPQTGRLSLTLSEAGTIVFYSNNYDYDFRAQAEVRGDKKGKTTAMNIIDLLTKGTVDEKIIKALKDKRRVAATVLGDAWKEWF